MGDTIIGSQIVPQHQYYPRNGLPGDAIYVRLDSPLQDFDPCLVDLGFSVYLSRGPDSI
jgi:hypothetical protein